MLRAHLTEDQLAWRHWRGALLRVRLKFSPLVEAEASNHQIGSRYGEKVAPAQSHPAYRLRIISARRTG